MFKQTLDRIGQLLALKKNKTHYADCVIRDEKGRICLLHRSYQDDFAPGKWCLPGGHIEDGEEPITAAGRELEEETGYKDVPLFYLDKVDRKDSVSLYYEGFVFSQTAVLLDNDEHYRIQWVELKDLDDYELLLDLKDTLAKLPLSPVPTLPEVAPIGEDLYTSWQNNLTSFDEGKIDESAFFKTIEIHKAVAAYELVTRAFDNDEITPEEFSRIHKVEKAEGFDQVLELAKGTDTEVLEEIVKGEVFEKKHKYIEKKSDGKGGWEYIYSSNLTNQRKGSFKKVFDLKDNSRAVLKHGPGSISEAKEFQKKPHLSPKVYEINEESDEPYAIIEKLDTESAQKDFEEFINKDRGYVHNWGPKLFSKDKDFKKIKDLLTTSKGKEMFERVRDIVLGLGMSDVHSRNFGYDQEGNLKAIDIRDDDFEKSDKEKLKKMDTGSVPGAETVTENGKLVKSEKIKGGLADNKTLKDVATHHKVELKSLRKEFIMGLEVEMEHTDDEEAAEEIAKDHLWEDPNYYTKLKKVEK